MHGSILISIIAGYITLLCFIFGLFNILVTLNRVAQLRIVSYLNVFARCCIYASADVVLGILRKHCVCSRTFLLAEVLYNRSFRYELQ